MFTGIVEALGELGGITPNGKGAKIKVLSNKLDFSDVKIGDSIACNGVCVTVVELCDNGFYADISHETIACTNFKNAQKGMKLNLEKALTPSTHMGGHIVQGHVDGVGEIEAIEKRDSVMDVWVKYPLEISKYIAHKGSITIDGISLTVNELRGNAFRLTLIPHTHAITTSDDWVKGQLVNIEVDVLSRYLERLLMINNSDKQDKTTLTKDILIENGFF